MATGIHAHPSLDFFPRQVDRGPSSLAFGFGLSSPSRMAPSSVLHASSAINQPPPTPLRSHKRRLEDGDDDLHNDHLDSKDVAMDRSPTPDRPRRVVPKRARVTNAADQGGKDDRAKRAGEKSSPENDVDVGMLLASLPQDSLLPLLRSLIETQPGLKPLVLSMIPRPSVDSALNALALAARKLRDAYPYSASSSTPSFLGPSASAPSASNFKPNALSFGFGSGSDLVSSSSPRHDAAAHEGSMRDDYIISRLAPHVSQFVSASLSYMPYFSYVPSPGTGNIQQTTRPYPHETYRYLAALTTHVLSQPPLARASLLPILLPRLLQEWNAWMDRISDVVNVEGGMFGRDSVQSWERSLDQYAEANDQGLQGFRHLRDRWVHKVGWLVGRTAVQAMDEEL